MPKKYITAAFGLLLAMLAPVIHAEEIRPIVPPLNFVTDCGECKVSGNVFGIATTAYAEAINKLGGSVNSGEAITVKIKDYSERTKAEALLLGVFSGKDLIMVHFTYLGKTFQVYHFTTSSYLGIDTVSSFIGKKIAKRVMESAIANTKVQSGVVNVTDNPVSNSELRAIPE